MLLLNDTVKTIPLKFEISSLSSLKWQLYLQMEMSFDMQKSLGAMSGEADVIVLKMIILTHLD
jgi:hypothetical protein